MTAAAYLAEAVASLAACAGMIAAARRMARRG